VAPRAVWICCAKVIWLEHIFPELAATIDCEQSPDFHPEGSVFNHICLMLENCRRFKRTFAVDSFASRHRKTSDG